MYYFAFSCFIFLLLLFRERPEFGTLNTYVRTFQIYTIPTIFAVRLKLNNNERYVRGVVERIKNVKPDIIIEWLKINSNDKFKIKTIQIISSGEVIFVLNMVSIYVAEGLVFVLFFLISEIVKKCPLSFLLMIFFLHFPGQIIHLEHEINYMGSNCRMVSQKLSIKII